MAKKQFTVVSAQVNEHGYLFKLQWKVEYQAQLGTLPAQSRKQQETYFYGTSATPIERLEDESLEAALIRLYVGKTMEFDFDSPESSFEVYLKDYDPEGTGAFQTKWIRTKRIGRLAK